MTPGFHCWFVPSKGSKRGSSLFPKKSESSHTIKEKKRNRIYHFFLVSGKLELQMFQVLIMQLSIYGNVILLYSSCSLLLTKKYVLCLMETKGKKES